MDIIIGFDNDDRVYELDKNIIKKYPNSILSLYDDVGQDETIIIKDATYEQFGIIYDVIMGKVKQWTVDDNILSLMDKYGLVNDSLLVLDKVIKRRMDNEFIMIDKFLNNKDEYLLMTYTHDQYEEYKNVFKNDKNIMSFQITFINNELFCINLLETIPIWFDCDFLEEKNIDNLMDINEIRYKVIVKNLNCIFDKCEMCDDCEPLEKMNFRCDKCVLCVGCKSHINADYFEDGYESSLIKRPFNKDIYSMDYDEYLSAIYNSDFMEYGELEFYQKLKPTTKNILNWSNVACESFMSDICNSLNNIAYTIYDDTGLIRDFYKKKNENIYDTVLDGCISCCNGPIVTHKATYKGFINVNHILQ